MDPGKFVTIDGNLYSDTDFGDLDRAKAKLPCTVQAAKVVFVQFE